MRVRGTLVHWNHDRAFGFIRIEGSGQDIFCHVSQCPNKQPLVQGQVVSFEMGRDAKGQVARNVLLEGPRLERVK